MGLDQATSGLLDIGDGDIDLIMGITLALVDVLEEVGAPVSTANVQSLAMTCSRLMDVALPVSSRQLGQLALLGLLSPLPAAAGELWERTDNDFAIGLREVAAPRLAGAMVELRGRAVRLARRSGRTRASDDGKGGT